MTVNGWALYAHPLLLAQIERLTAAVEADKAKDPEGYGRKANAKTLKAIHTAMFVTVPQDPARADYRQGTTLGPSRKHWFRVKFGNGRFRLFFRYDSRAKVIIFAWVNDENSLRTYGSKTDAYAVFKGMLDTGNPPDSWDALLKAVASGHAVRGRSRTQD
nr:type II toxin-antitoxin system YhaV family toxin [Azorhizobium oxalatiphilum]